MNIEYDFENKKYEAAITKIKATIMDIISVDMLSSKRNDKVLIEILKTMNELEKHLEELDKTSSNEREVPKEEIKSPMIKEDVIKPEKKEETKPVVVPTVEKNESKVSSQVKEVTIPTVKMPIESKEIGGKTTENIKSTIVPTATSNNQQVHFDFQKADNTPPKAIITSANQSIKLRKSLKTQEALVNFKSDLNNKNDGGNEDSIEKMMNEAALLYKEGKAEEAQRMYDKISEMNRQIKADPANLNTLTMR